MEVLIALAVSLAAGLLATRVFKALGLDFPDVTAFLLAGMVIGPYGIGRLGISGLGFASYEAVEALGVINTTALGFIAFSIGSEFRLSSMKHIGKPALVIGIFQALTATVLVDAALQLSVFAQGQMVLIGLVYILARCAGKYFGARESARAMHGDQHIVKYLGITLFPQAGVALGMVRLAQALGGTEADTIRNVILFSVMIYELVGPSLTRMALQKAGEIVPTPPHKRSRKRFAPGR